MLKRNKKLLLIIIIIFSISSIKAQNFDIKAHYLLKNSATGQYLSLTKENKIKGNGTQVCIVSLNKDIFQELVFTKENTNFFLIQFAGTSFDLDVHGCFDGKPLCGTYKRQNGAEIQIWTVTAKSSPHLWKFEELENNKYRIVNKYSGKVLDLKFTNKNETTYKVVQWQWNAKDTQLWEIIKVQ